MKAIRNLFRVLAAAGTALFFAACASEYNPACDECDFRHVHSHVQGKNGESYAVKTYSETKTVEDEKGVRYEIHNHYYVLPAKPIFAETEQN